MEENTFRNLQGVTAYLRGQGWKVSKSTIYDHGRARKIKPRTDGLFHLSDVETYASAYLKQRIAPTMSQAIDNIQHRRNEAEARKIEAQAHHWEVKAQVAAGAFVPRDAFEHALAQRAAVLKADVENFIRGGAEKIITLVNGDPAKAPALIEHQLDAAADWLNRYAADREFKIPAAASADAAADLQDDPDDEDDDKYLENKPENEHY